MKSKKSKFHILKYEPPFNSYSRNKRHCEYSIIISNEAIEMLERLNTEFKSKPVPYIQKCLKEALKEAK